MHLPNCDAKSSRAFIKIDPGSFAPGSGKSYSDLLMLNDFGVDASIGVPFDFELDGQNKKVRLDFGNNKEQQDVDRSVVLYELK